MLPITRPKKSISLAKNREIKFVLLKSFMMNLPMMHWQFVSQFDSTEVLKIFRRLGNCHSNLNQIAKHLYQGGEPNGQVRRQVLDCISDLYEMRVKLEEMIGEYHCSH